MSFAGASSLGKGVGPSAEAVKFPQHQLSFSEEKLHTRDISAI